MLPHALQGICDKSNTSETTIKSVRKNARSKANWKLEKGKGREKLGKIKLRRGKKSNGITWHTLLKSKYVLQQRQQRRRRRRRPQQITRSTCSRFGSIFGAYFGRCCRARGVGEGGGVGGAGLLRERGNANKAINCH